MQKHILMTSTQLEDKQKSILFDGICDVNISEDALTFTYLEKKQSIKVTIKASVDTFEIERKGELSSFILLKTNELTKGYMDCEFGKIDLNFMMRKYFFLPHLIIVEYDVIVDGEVQNSLRIICKIKEVEA